MARWASTFLHRNELDALWDTSIFLDVAFDVTAARMAARDGSSPHPQHPDMRRYVEGQRIYFRECGSTRRADIVIDNTDFDPPTLIAPSS